MRKIIIDNKEEIKKLKIGEGSYSKCYLYDSNTIVKVFNDFNRRGYNYNCNEESLKLLEKLKTYTLCKPNGILYDKNNNLVAVLMDYIKGDTLKISLDKKIQLEAIFKDYNKVINDFKVLSQNRIRTYDICEQNIIYNNVFYIIDTYEYNVNTNYSKERCFNDSKRHFDRTLLKNILFQNNEEISKIQNICKKDKELNKICNDYINNENIDIIYFINLLIEKTASQEVSTIDDLRNIKVYRKFY